MLRNVPTYFPSTLIFLFSIITTDLHSTFRTCISISAFEHKIDETRQNKKTQQNKTHEGTAACCSFGYSLITAIRIWTNEIVFSRITDIEVLHKYIYNNSDYNYPYSSGIHFLSYLSLWDFRNQLFRDLYSISFGQQYSKNNTSVLQGKNFIY